MITLRQMLDAMAIPYVDDGSPELDYELRITDPDLEGDDEIKGMVNDHEEKRIVLSTEVIGS